MLDIMKANQEWLAEHGESFLDYQRRVDQITADMLGMTYQDYLDWRQHV